MGHRSSGRPEGGGHGGQFADPGLYFMPGSSLSLWRPGPKRFDPMTRTWRDGEPAGKGAEAVSPETAVVWLQRNSGYRLRAPVAVIGARDAAPGDLQIAEQVGHDLAKLGLVVLTGGKGGVMEAASRGVEDAGGLSIGLLPDDHWSGANGHVGVPLASGLGPARNAIIARSAFALIAIAGGYGTLSEIALGLQFNRTVLSLPSAPQVPGAIFCDDWPGARFILCKTILGL